MSPARPALAIPALTAAAPDLALGAAFLVVWLAPVPLEPSVIAHLTLLMLLEFITMHSSAFMGTTMFRPGPRKAKLLTLLAIAGFYTLFVGSFSLMFKTAWPLVSFWLLSLNRMMGVLLGNAPQGEEQAFVRRSWAASAIAYLLGAFVTVLLPVPRLGLTEAVVGAQDLVGSGLWVSQPHRLVAFGFLYFTAVGLSELGGHAWAKDAKMEGGGGRPRIDDRHAA